MKEPASRVKKILIVEDEPAICDICRRVLTEVGFEVDIANDGKVAQAMIEEKQYDLCLVDIKIPTMSGKELYHWLQTKHPWQAGRVIFTTGDVMGGDTKDFLEQTKRPFLTKPFTPGEVRDIMKATLLREVENERGANKSTGG